MLTYQKWTNIIKNINIIKIKINVKGQMLIHSILTVQQISLLFDVKDVQG